MRNDFNMPRRRLLASTLIILPELVLTGVLPVRAAGARGELEPTPSCGAADELTPAQTAGPFFKPRSPERKSLIEPGIQGRRIVLEGHVRTTECQSIKGALVDFWQADSNGVYDNAGYRLRGHQYSDASGRYRLETIVPGVYPGRTRHFHVRIQAPNRPVLTTQLYFPGAAENQRDAIFNPKLVIAPRGSTGSKSANFNFVLDLG
jgi:protocatechuate 3,4-dioxygenase beta subunit